MLNIRLPLLIIKRLRSTRAEFFDVGIVPRIIRAGPQCKLEVLLDKHLKLGRVYKPNFLTNPPDFISWGSMCCNKLYTFMLIDPDYPSRKDPSQRSWLHWLIINMKGDKVYHGTTIAHYIRPIPMCRTGYHRLIFLVFRQKRKIDPCTMTVLSNSSFKGRKCFCVPSFIEDNCLVPSPEAGTFIYTEYDDSVRDELKKLKFGTFHEKWVRNRRQSC